MNEEFLKQYKAELEGDDHIFVLVNLKKPVAEQLPQLVVGHHAKQFAQAGGYHIEYQGLNKTSKANRIKKSLDEARKGAEKLNIQLPQSLIDENAALKARLAELEAKNAKGSTKKGDETNA